MYRLDVVSPICVQCSHINCKYPHCFVTPESYRTNWYTSNKLPYYLTIYIYKPSQVHYLISTTLIFGPFTTSGIYVLSPTTYIKIKSAIVTYKRLITSIFLLDIIYRIIKQLSFEIGGRWHHLWFPSTAFDRHLFDNSYYLTFILCYSQWALLKSDI